MPCGPSPDPRRIRSEPVRERGGGGRTANWEASVSVTIVDIEQAARTLGLDGRPVCVHGSPRSFGYVEGGAATVVDGLLAQARTVLALAFSTDTFAVAPPPDQRPERNGSDYARTGSAPGHGRVYTPVSDQIERGLGAIPAAVLARAGRKRGDHPLNSFAAVGPLARQLIAGQTGDRVYAPLEALAEERGAVLLIGVGLTSMTLLHLAEERAGRTLFRRWANGPDGRPRMVQAGGCSDGFGRLAPVLAPFQQETRVGASRWLAFPAAAALRAAVAAIRADPSITHCGNRACERCNDAVLGGPILDHA